MKKICLILAALTLAAVCHAKTYDLRYNLKPGKTYSNHLKAEIKMTMFDTININMDMIMEIDLEVKARRDTLYDMEVTYKRMRIATQRGPHDIIIDSDDKESVSYESVLARTLIGRPFPIVMSYRGQVIEFDGFDKLFDPDGVDFTGVPEETVQKVKAEMKKNRDNKESMIKDLMGGVATFPSHPVAIGDEWETSFAMKGSFGMATNARYRLTDVNRKHFVIDMTTNISIDKPETATKGMATSMEGTMLLDRKTLWPESMTIDMIMEPSDKNQKVNVKSTGRIIVTDGRER